MSQTLCRDNGAWEFALRSLTRNERWCGKGAKLPLPRWAASRPNYIVQDGVIPRTALPHVLTEIDRMSSAAGLRVANVFHAGDGNLHPLVLYDRSIPGQEEIGARSFLSHPASLRGSWRLHYRRARRRQRKAGGAWLHVQEPDLATMQLVRCAFDPENIANPDKVFPRPRLCAEKPGPYTPHPLETAGIAEIF